MVVGESAGLPSRTLIYSFMHSPPPDLQVGSTIFAHGGVLRNHVDYGLERINREAQVWGYVGGWVGPKLWIGG